MVVLWRVTMKWVLKTTTSSSTGRSSSESLAPPSASCLLCCTSAKDVAVGRTPATRWRVSSRRRRTAAGPSTDFTRICEHLWVDDWQSMSTRRVFDAVNCRRRAALCPSFVSRLHWRYRFVRTFCGWSAITTIAQCKSRTGGGLLVALRNSKVGFWTVFFRRYEFIGWKVSDALSCFAVVSVRLICIKIVTVHWWLERSASSRQSDAAMNPPE